MHTGQTLIVDGYNVIHKIPRFRALLTRSLESARDRLVLHCATWLACRKNTERILVVFDGKQPDSTETCPRPDIRVIYSRNGETADDYIVGLVRNGGKGMRYTVVSDDQELAGRTRQLGGRVLSVVEFCDRPEEAACAFRRKGSDSAKPGLPPATEQRINADLRQQWHLE